MIWESLGKCFASMEACDRYCEKEKKRLTQKYQVIGDDAGIAFGAYENMINIKGISKEDAEEIVYSEQRLNVDFVAENMKDSLDFLCDVGIILENYTILQSGHIALNLN